MLLENSSHQSTDRSFSADPEAEAEAEAFSSVLLSVFLLFLYPLIGPIKAYTNPNQIQTEETH